MGDTSATEIVAADGSFLCDAFNAKEAAFIVTACNEHARLDELVNANVIARCNAQDRAEKLAEKNAALLSAVWLFCHSHINHKSV